MNQVKFGIQLYSVRNQLNADFRGTLAKLAAMGFQGVEFAFYYGEMKPEDLAMLVKELQLNVYGIYERFQNLCDSEHIVYDYAAAMGCSYLTGGLGAQLEKDYASCVEKAGKACSVASKHGLTICYHAHAQEFKKVDGVCLLDRLLADIPEMRLEPDTAWIHLGGQNVLEHMEKHAARIPLIHAKDVTADGKITELGKGVIDFAAVLQFAQAHNIEWLIYEQDGEEDLDPVENALMSIDFLKSISSCGRKKSQPKTAKITRSR